MQIHKKQAYEKAITRQGVTAFVQKYTEESYETFYEEIPFIINSFPMSQKNNILKTSLRKEGIQYWGTIDIYDYMYWGNCNAQIQKLAEKALPENEVLMVKMIIIYLKII